MKTVIVAGKNVFSEMTNESKLLKNYKSEFKLWNRNVHKKQTHKCCPANDIACENGFEKAYFEFESMKLEKCLHETIIYKNRIVYNLIK